MKIAILGASAGVGLKTVERALERGHTVVTLSRSPVPLPANKNLISMIGSATKVEDVAKTITDVDAVIVAIGTGKSMKATTVYSEVAEALIAARILLNTNVPFIILTGFGAGKSGEYNSFLMKIVFATLLKAVYADKTRMEERIAASSIRWEFVRPGLLTDKPLSEKYRVETTLFKGINIGSISRSDVADFMVKQAENPTELGQYPALSNT